MKIYIGATANISPQHTFGSSDFLQNIIEYHSNRLSCVEPDYKDYVDSKMIRRMSRIIKLGVATANACLKDAGVSIPDAITTGTAYGCLEDTGAFLGKMIEYKEELLTPTAFIQSTHNTIGAQVALGIKCHQYNNAFVHRGFSFESALLDAILLLKDQEVDNALVGAIDEITDYSHQILTRFGLYKQDPVNNVALYNTTSKGTIGGEGAAFFFLHQKAHENNLAALQGLHTFYKPSGIAAITTSIASFLQSQAVDINEIDLLILGRNGDTSGDAVYNELQQGIFNNIPSLNYKNLCGEYPTATAFATWLAAQIIKRNEVPAVFNVLKPADKRIQKILIYNHYLQIHHSVLLLSAC